MGIESIIGITLPSPCSTFIPLLGLEYLLPGRQAGRHPAIIELRATSSHIKDARLLVHLPCLSIRGACMWVVKRI